MIPDDHMPGNMPERETDPRDDRTGWERNRSQAVCSCGRIVVVRGKCAWCLHGVVPT